MQQSESCHSRTKQLFTNTAMQYYHGYHFSITGVLMFGILQGVHVVLANPKTVIRARGSSLNFQPEYPDGTVSFAQWNFNGKKFADYTSNRNYSFPESQFSGRLKENHDKVGVTVQNLQPQDSGTFSVVLILRARDGTREQLPTQTFKVYIEDPITAVQIEKNQAWRLSTNSCDVDVKCTALGAESVSYLWSGYKNGSGAQLQFSLSPAEGAVTLNCTAVNNVSSISATETLSCSAEYPEVTSNFPEDHRKMKNNILKPEWIIAAVGGAAIFLIIAVIVAVMCWRKSHKDGSVDNCTVYADVNTGAVTQKDRRSDSVVNGITVYETVDDLRVGPEMTIYAKVTHPQHKQVSATSSSPYQQVL